MTRCDVVVLVFGCLLGMARGTHGVENPQAAVPTSRIVEGRVTDALGEPLRNARIWVSDRGLLEPALEETRTDALGVFAMRVEQGRGLRIHAQGEGRCCVSMNVPEAAVPLRFELHEAVTVRGHVLDAQGRAVRDAPVWAHPAKQERGIGICARARTDAAGRFELEGVPLGGVHAWIQGEGLRMGSVHASQDDEVVFAPASTDRATLRIAIEGLSAAERGMAILRVAAHGTGTSRVGSFPEHPAPFVTRGVPDGLVELVDLPCWPFRVSIDVPGLVVSPAEHSTRGVGPHDLEFVLVRGDGPKLRVGVRLVDGQGQAIPGVHGQLFGRRGLPPVEVVSDELGRFQEPVRCDDDGNVEFVLGDSGWRFDVFGKPESAVRTRWASLDGGYRELRLRPAVAIEGRLSTPDGEPAALSRVALLRRRAAEETWHVAGEAWSDRAGRFRMAPLGEFAGESRLQIREPSGVAELPIALGESGVEHRLGDVRLSPAASVSGTVVDKNGVPAAGVEVMLHVRTSDPFGAYVRTDSQGRYRIAVVPTGEARISCVSPSGSLQPSPWFPIGEGEAVVRDLTSSNQ